MQLRRIEGNGTLVFLFCFLHPAGVERATSGTFENLKNKIQPPKEITVTVDSPI